jgi:predicted N-acetyltransferase YhbS
VVSGCDALIRRMTPADAAAVGALGAAAFGPGRFARTAFRVREVSGPPAVALVAVDGGRLVGSIELTRICIGGAPGAMLLGPLTIAPEYRGRRCGLTLMEHGIGEAKALGTRLVLLVGDLPYYAKAGFMAVPPGAIRLPGPVNPARLLARELDAGALAAYRGLVTADV